MTLPPIYVLRHGESEWNRARRMQGRLDSPLTAKGRAQAAALGDLLCEMELRPEDHEFRCSPQGRAMETAELALGPLGIVAETDPLLREISLGDWDGRTLDEIEADYPTPDPHETFLEFLLRSPNGDTFDALWARVGEVLESITRPTVLVTHGVTSRFLRTRALGLGMDRLEDVPGGQGVINAIVDGEHRVYRPSQGPASWSEGVL